MSETHLLEDTFTITHIDDEKYDRVARISGPSSDSQLQISLDINKELYQVSVGESIQVLLASTLDLESSHNDALNLDKGDYGNIDSMDYDMGHSRLHGSSNKIMNMSAGHDSPMYTTSGRGKSASYFDGGISPAFTSRMSGEDIDDIDGLHYGGASVHDHLAHGQTPDVSNPLDSRRMRSQVALGNSSTNDPNLDHGWRKFSQRKGQLTLADLWDYVCYGKIYRFDDAPGDQINIFASFGGLLLMIKGPYERLTSLRINHVYLLIKK